MTADFYRAMAEKATDLLGDGEWHPYEPIARALMKVVPPGPALRKAEATRRASLKQRGRPDDQARKRQRSTEQLIASGQRTLVRAFIGNPAVFEIERPSQRGAGGNMDWRIRMVGRHRLLTSGEAPEQRRQLEAENTELRREITMLRAQVKERDQLLTELRDFLNKHGFRADAKRIVDAYEGLTLIDAASSRSRRT